MPTTVLPSSTPTDFLQERVRGRGSDRSGFMSTPTACLISLTVDFLETRRTHEISLTVDEARTVKTLSSGLAPRKAPGKSWSCGRLAKHPQHTTVAIFSISDAIYCMDCSIFACIFMHAVACVIVAMWRSRGKLSGVTSLFHHMGSRG